jgi:TetR/AcrR family transcriptional regulator, cholesterol catabolism regulator
MELAESHKKNIKTKIKDEALLEKKRMLIIKTAAKLFSKKGFQKTTINDIASASGMTTGSIYNYVNEKEDILFLMQEYFQTMFIKHIDMGIRKGTDIKSRCENAFQNLLSLESKHQKGIRLIYIETASQTKLSLKALIDRQTQLIEKIRELIDCGVEAKIFHVEDSRFAASIINFLIFYQSLNGWDIEQMRLKDSEVREYLLSSIYRILGYNEAACKQ